MHRWLKTLIVGATIAGGLALAACGQKSEEAAAPAAASAGQEYTIAWTIYAGWMPWPYAEQAGIVKKWSDKYGVDIKVVQVNDYVESLNQFTAGKVVGVTAANMDALTLPAAAGVDTTAIIMGDYSNGNDGIVLKGANALPAIRGRTVNLVENSVSHYLLARGLESVGLKLPDVKVVNTSDADITAAFSAPETTAMVTWNPMLSEIAGAPGAAKVFDSSQIPGEIQDLLIVNTEALKANPNLGKALAGIWYETMALMKAQTPEGAAAREAMAKLSGTDLAGYEAQLKTTAMYYEPQAALDFLTGTAVIEATDKVRKFSFEMGLFGQGATSVDDIGIAFPSRTLGNPENVKLRFDPTFTQMAAKGEL